MKHKTSSRALRLSCLLLALVFTASFPAAAAAGGESTRKDETVYVNLDSSGNPLGTTVSDWLHSDSGAAQIADRSNLTDIRNVKSSEQPVRRGDSLTWAPSSGDDIYYEGKTSARPPLAVSVAYTLDGKSVSPQEIAGKSGRVQIRIAVRNTAAQEVTAGGKRVTMYTPMTAVVAAALPSETFRNVTVSDGKTISDGSNQFVVFLAMPGLSESLGLKNCGVEGFDSLDLPEEFTITADAAGFEMGPIGIAATPELPKEEDLGKGGNLDSLKTDLDKLRAMQDNIELADPKRETRSLFTNPDRTAAARLLIDDVFDFYSLDTAAIDILPRYVTDKNISLYDRVTSDLDKADLKYLLDNKIIRGLNDRMTDENTEKAKALLSDYDELQTLSMGKVDRALKVMNRYDRDYDHLDGIFKDARHVLNRLDKDDAGTLDALASSEVRNALSDTLESMNALASSGLVSPSFRLTQDNVKALMESVLADHPDLMEDALEGQFSGMADENGLIAASDLTDLLESSGLTREQQAAAAKRMTDAVTGGSSGAVVPVKDVQNVLAPVLGGLPADRQAAAAQALAGMTDQNGNVKVRDLPALASRLGLAPDEALIGGLTPHVLLPEDEAETLTERLLDDPGIKTALLGGMMDSSAISGLTSSLNDLLSGSAQLDSGLKKKLGSRYTDKLTDALSHMGGLKSSLDDLQDDLDDLDEEDEEDLEDDFDDAEDLLLDKDGMDYLIGWANRLKTMKSDMDGSGENISVLRDLLTLNDDPKIKNFRRLYPTLQADLDETRPILDSIKEQLDRPDVNASFHKLPQTTATLLDAERDIRNNRAIMDIFRLTTQPKTVSLFQDTFGTLDEFTQKDTADKITGLLDRKDAYVALSDRYGIFTEAAGGAETSVKFVYKTAEIKKPEAPKASPAQNAQASGEGDSGFWGWIRSAWNRAANTISRLF